MRRTPRIPLIRGQCYWHQRAGEGTILTMTNDLADVSVVIFSSREAPADLAHTIQAVLAALPKEDVCVVDVLVNGNPALASGILGHLPATLPASIRLRVWHLAAQDKAYAWNEYLYNIYPGAAVAFFVDGYVRVRPDALSLMSAALLASDCLAASAVPSVGHSRKALREAMLRDGGMHGNLYALKRSTIDRLKLADFKLPQGIYRNDSMMAAALCFNLGPDEYDWDPRRIIVHPDATWTFRTLKWWRRSDLASHFRRVIRQAQGALENKAVRQHFAVERRSPGTLPRSVSELVMNWYRAASPEERLWVRRNPLRLLALRRLQRMPAPAAQGPAPELIFGTI